MGCVLNLPTSDEMECLEGEKIILMESGSRCTMSCCLANMQVGMSWYYRFKCLNDDFTRLVMRQGKIMCTCVCATFFFFLQ